MIRRRFLRTTGAALSAASLRQITASGGYTRRYDPVQPADFDIGMIYIPFVGNSFGRSTGARMPAVGYYDMSDSDTINRQIDQMQGHGVTTLMFNYGESINDFDRFRQFRQAELTSEIAIEAFWTIHRPFQRGLDIERQIEFFREEMLPIENYNRYEGRPVVQLWAAGALYWNDDINQELTETYGSPAAFIRWFRDELTVGNTEPYLICNDPHPGDRPVFAAEFDGFTDWFGGLFGRRYSWEEFTDTKYSNALYANLYAEHEGVDFIPTAVAGFDDSVASGEFRGVVPKSPANLTEMLFDFSDAFRTRNRINIATFNDWMEGHQLEPGQMDGIEYGTAYLERIKEYAYAKMGLTEDCRAMSVRNQKTQTCYQRGPKPTPWEFAPLELRFNKGVGEPGYVQSFRLDELEFYDGEHESLVLFENIQGVGDTLTSFEDAAVISAGGFWSDSNEDHSWVWLGSSLNAATIHIPAAILGEAVSGRIRGKPERPDTSASVVVDGSVTDQLEFTEVGAEDYQFDLTQSGDMQSSTDNGTESSQEEASPSPQGAESVGERPQIGVGGGSVLAGTAALGYYMYQRTRRE
jgi:hypothetical protein